MKIKKEIRLVILTVCVCVFVVSAVYLIKYFIDGEQSKEDFENMQNIVTADVSYDSNGEIIDEYAPNGMILGYYNLWQQNNDMVGWIKINDTVIDYPVMHKSDDWQFYMNRNFYGEKQSRGTPFVDIESNVFKPSTNIVIYGHNMRDKSMFAALHEYKDKEFWQSHQIINFDTLYKRGEYQVIAALETTANNVDGAFKYNQYVQMDTEEDFNNFINTAKYLSFYDTGVSAEFGDELLTLSTCAYDMKNGRIVVIAKRILTEEEQKERNEADIARMREEFKAEQQQINEYVNQ